MRIAYLILAHDQPRQFQRLVKALTNMSMENAVYVHIDLKSDISHFRCRDIAESNTTFITNRVSVNHGGYSLTTAMLNLITTATATGQYDYYLFLSGRDYPIKNSIIINEYLSSNYPLNFINFYPLIGDADWIGNIDRYYFIDFLAKSPWLIRLALKGIHKIMYPLFPKRSFIRGMTPFRGSQWFCLNRDTITYITEFLASDKSSEYIAFFKRVSCSDEIFFHTIVLNSKYASSCYLYDQYILEQEGNVVRKNENKAYLHYIDWDRDREDPAVLDMTDFQALKDSSALFARKFCQYKSQQLLEHIDDHLLYLSNNVNITT